jgi:hypothetical protein
VTVVDALAEGVERATPHLADIGKPVRIEDVPEPVREPAPAPPPREPVPA